MSREVIIKVLDNDELKPQFSQDGNVYKATLPSPYENMGELIRCKDCKFFELDHIDNYYSENVKVASLITAHEICTKWGNGCKTDKDGYCFMAERREQ